MLRQFDKSGLLLVGWIVTEAADSHGNSRASMDCPSLSGFDHPTCTVSMEIEPPSTPSTAGARKRITDGPLPYDSRIAL